MALNLEAMTFTLGQYELLDLLADGAAVSHVTKIAKSLVEKQLSNDIRLDLAVNDVCNLKCSHCYYSSTHIGQSEADKNKGKKKNRLNLDEYNVILTSALKYGVERFSIAGKEPLLSPDITFNILRILAEAKKDPSKKFENIDSELLTNGTLLSKYVRQLSEVSPNRVVISVDGFEEQNDTIRGAGNYRLAKQGLELLINQGLSDVAVSYVAISNVNTSKLNHMLTDLSHSGVRRFGIGFAFPTEHNNIPEFDSASVYDLIKSVINASSRFEKDKSFVTIQLAMNEHPDIIAQLYKEKVIHSHSICFFDSKMPYIFIHLRENTYLQIDVLPKAGFNNIRIEPTGKVVFDYRSVSSASQLQEMTSVQEHDFDFSKIINAVRDYWKSADNNYYHALETFKRGLGR